MRGGWRTKREREREKGDGRRPLRAHISGVTPQELGGPMVAKR